MFTGSLALDVLLGDVHSLKEKRSVVRPVVAELRKKFEVSVAEAGHLDLHRRALIGVAVVAADAAHCRTVLDACERLVADRPELEVLSAHQRLMSSEDEYRGRRRTGPQARCPDPRGGRVHARDAGQGPAARDDHHHRREAHPGPARGDAVLHGLRRRRGPPGHRHGAREREGRPAQPGRQADRRPLHAVAGLHRRRRARDHRAARGAAGEGPARRRPRPRDRRGRRARR